MSGLPSFGACGSYEACADSGAMIIAQNESTVYDCIFACSGDPFCLAVSYQNTTKNCILFHTNITTLSIESSNEWTTIANQNGVFLNIPVFDQCKSAQGQSQAPTALPTMSPTMRASSVGGRNLRYTHLNKKYLGPSSLVKSDFTSITQAFYGFTQLASLSNDSNVTNTCSGANASDLSTVIVTVITQNLSSTNDMLQAFDNLVQNISSGGEGQATFLNASSICSVSLIEYIGR